MYRENRDVLRDCQQWQNMYERLLGVPMRGFWLERMEHKSCGVVIVAVQWWAQFERRDRRGPRTSLIEARLRNSLCKLTSIHAHILSTKLSGSIAAFGMR